MLTARAYLIQRLSALLMAPFVLGHLAVMIYAIEGGLSVGEILGRTQDSLIWFLFYGSFVLAVSIHAALGLKVILAEWAGITGQANSVISWVIGLGLLIMGGQAIWSVTFA